MLYKILRVLMTYALNFYFRKIEVEGKKNIPKNGPIIFACNHPSSFMEAILLACFQPRTMHFLVRGDVFRIKWLKALLVHTNQIPIFRFRDGFKNLKKNKETFAKAHEILANNGAIIIYAEGSTLLIKKLRSLQRGMAKLAFGAWEEGQVEGIQVVPIGVNYMDVLSWRSDVMIEVGQPILVEDYLKFYRANPVECIRQLTQDTYKAMKPLVIHFDHYCEAHDLLLAEAVRKNKATNISNYQSQKRLSDQIANSEIKSSYVFKNHHYSYWASSKNTLLSLLKLVVLFIPAMLGFLIILPILKLGEIIAVKNKLSDEFIAPAKVAILLLLGLVIYIALIIISLASKSLLFVFAALGLPIWIVLAGYFKDELDYFSGRMRHKYIESNIEEITRQLSS